MSLPFPPLLPNARLRVLGLCAFLAVVSLVPSVGTLGYFYSLALAPLAALWGIFLGQRHSAGDPVPRLRRILMRAWPELVLQLGAWFLMLCLAQLWSPSCDFSSGLAFWALGPVCSLLLGWSVAVLCASQRLQGFKARVLPYAVFGVCTIWGLWRLYKNPVVFAFDPFWGYFSGPIYDELVRAQPRYLYYRAYNFLWIAAGFCLARFGELRASPEPDAATPGSAPQHSRPRGLEGDRPKGLLWLGLGLVLVLTALVPASQRPRFGWSASSQSLQEELSLQKRTEHFVIHYAPYSSSAAQIEALAMEHEFAWHRLEQKLGYAPPSPIESFVFSSPSQKRRLFGAGRVEVSLPWRQQIYLNHQDAPHRVLHHELAHAFGRHVGDGLFGLSRRGWSLNGGLIEGYATALAPRSVGDLGLHDQAAIVDRLDKRPPMSVLMGPGFWRYSSSRAYTSAGSFCLWLLEQFGPEKLSQVYQYGGSFQSVYSTRLEDLEKSWVDFLRTRSIDEKDLAIQRARYSRRSVFDRPCAHKIAVALQEVSHLQARADHQGAAELLRELCRIDPGELHHQIRLARFLAENQDPKGAQAVLQEALHRGDLRVRQRGELLGVVADIAWRSGELHEAQRALGQALALPIPAHQRRALAIKRQAIRGPEDQRQTLFQYFEPGDEHEPASATQSRRLFSALHLGELAQDASVGPYLEGLVWRSRHAPLAATRALQQALKRDLWPDSEDSGLRRNALKTLRTVAFQAHKLAIAQEAQDALTLITPQKSGQVLQNQLWQERLDFASHYFRPKSPSP